MRHITIPDETLNIIAAAAEGDAETYAALCAAYVICPCHMADIFYCPDVEPVVPEEYVGSVIETGRGRIKVTENVFADIRSGGWHETAVNTDEAPSM